MPGLSIIVAVLIIAAFGFGFYWIINSARKLKLRKREIRLTLGFQPVEIPDPALENRLIGLYQKREHQKLKIQEMYLRSEGDYQLYLYEVWDHSGNDSDLQDEMGLAIISGYLNLPRFSMIYRIDMPGKLAAMANRLIEKIAAKNQQKINFDSHPEFSRRYMVLGEDEPAVRHLFSEHIVNRLGETSFWAMDGGGNILTFTKFDPDRKLRSKPEELNERLQEARQIFQLFSETSVRN